MSKRSARKTATTAAASGSRPAARVGASAGRSGSPRSVAGVVGAVVVVGVVVVVLAAAFWWLRRGDVYHLPSTPDQNILLITLDTTRADALSAYGGPAKTPNIDALANHGARFTFAHAHVPLTLPSHTSILTGRLPYEHGVRDNAGFRVPAGTVTLATRLKPLGFATGAFIGGFPLTKRFGLTPDFDEYDDQIPEMRGDITFSMGDRRADEVTARASAWAARQTTKFFQWVHLFDAHSPYQPPPEYAAAYASQPYYGEIAFIDHALQPLFDTLARQPRPTTVIITADHGESLGEHGEETHAMFAYESTLRVPLIIATIPGTGASAPAAARGEVIDAPVRHIDIVPTVLDTIGAPADPALAGVSMRGVIDGSAAARDTARPTYFEAMSYNLTRGWAPLRGVIVAAEKYIDLPIAELYDLTRDPKELTNLASAQPDRTRALLNTLKTYNMAPPNRPAAETSENAAALRSLGYVSGSAAPKEVYTERDDPKTLADLDRLLHDATNQNQTGHPDAAIATLKEAIARRKDTADAYLNLGYIYYQRGQMAEAIQTLEDGLTAGAPNRDIRIRLGLYLAESHANPAKAIAVLEGLPDTDVEALNGLGIAYSDAGRYADAMRTFKRVLQLDPTNGLAFQNMAGTTLHSGPTTPARMTEAEGYLRQALAADPTLAGAYTMLGVVMSSTGRAGEAVTAWQRALEFDPTDLNAIYNLWLELARAGRHADAIQYARQYLATAPEAAFAKERAEIASYLRSRER